MQFITRFAVTLATVVGVVQGKCTWAEEDTAVLDETVVTATKSKKLASEAPASVSVITAREIQERNVQRVDQALAGTAGVYVRANPGDVPSPWSNTVQLRGIPGYYRTGVLVDGQPINNAFSGGVNMSLVPVDEISQIEVVPGPFSSLYGGAGMAGVINVITKVPEKREIGAAAGYGTHDLKTLDLSYRDKIGGVGVSVYYEHKDSGGYTSDYVTKSPSGAGGTVVTGWEATSTTTGRAAYIVGDKGDKPWRLDTGGVKLYFTPSADSKLVLDASYHTHTTQFDQYHSYLRSGTSVVDNGTVNIDGSATTLRVTDFLFGPNGEDVSRLAASYEGPIGAGASFKIAFGYLDSDYWYISQTANTTNASGPGTYTDIPSAVTNADLQFSIPLGARNLLIAGLSANDSTLHKKVYPLANWRADDERDAAISNADGYSTLLAPYVQDEIAATDALTFYLGARYDRWSTHGALDQASPTVIHQDYETRTKSMVSPKASVVYRFGQGTVIKGAIGRAFRAPNLSDMYSTWTSTGGVVYWANPDLQPEKATSGEIGVEHEFARGTSVRATYFESAITDLIYSTSTSATDNNKFNAGKAQARGIELEARRRFAGTLSAFANATFVNTKITENSVKPASVGQQVPLQARKMANVGIEGRVGSWSGSVIGQYVGKVYSTDDNTDVVNNVPGSYDPYFVTNVKLGYRFGESVSASIAVNNAFDRDYYCGSSKADGRTWYVGVNVRH